MPARWVRWATCRSARRGRKCGSPTSETSHVHARSSLRTLHGAQRAAAFTAVPAARTARRISAAAGTAVRMSRRRTTIGPAAHPETFIERARHHGDRRGHRRRRGGELPAARRPCGDAGRSRPPGRVHVDGQCRHPEPGFGGAGRHAGDSQEGAPVAHRPGCAAVGQVGLPAAGGALVVALHPLEPARASRGDRRRTASAARADLRGIPHADARGWLYRPDQPVGLHRGVRDRSCLPGRCACMAVEARPRCEGGRTRRGADP